MSKKRRNHSPEFKAKVALATIKGDQSIAELSQHYNLAQNQISTWKKQLLERSAEVFASGKGLAPNHSFQEFLDFRFLAGRIIVFVLFQQIKFRHFSLSFPISAIVYDHVR